jgi:hypothetical protein
MKTAYKIVLVVLVTITMGEAKEDLENILMEMNERIALNEAKLIKNEEEIKRTLIQNQEDLKKTQEELLELTSRNIQLEERLQMAEDDLTATKNPPFFHACGAHYDSIDNTQSTIAYTSLLYSSTNTEGGDLDTSSGVFTCPQTGSYTITWSLRAHARNGPSVRIYLRQNGQNIKESYHKSSLDIPDIGYVGDVGTYTNIYTLILTYYYNIPGGRTLVLHLDRGDTLDLYCEECYPSYIEHLTFCVSLSTFD